MAALYERIPGKHLRSACCDAPTMQNQTTGVTYCTECFDPVCPHCGSGPDHDHAAARPHTKPAGWLVVDFECGGQYAFAGPDIIDALELCRVGLDQVHLEDLASPQPDALSPTSRAQAIVSAVRELRARFAESERHDDEPNEDWAYVDGALTVLDDAAERVRKELAEYEEVHRGH